MKNPITLLTFLAVFSAPRGFAEPDLADAAVRTAYNHCVSRAEQLKNRDIDQSCSGLRPVFTGPQKPTEQVFANAMQPYRDCQNRKLLLADKRKTGCETNPDSYKGWR